MIVAFLVADERFQCSLVVGGANRPHGSPPSHLFSFFPSERAHPNQLVEELMLDYEDRVPIPSGSGLIGLSTSIY